jgi:hypothetical protein
MQKWQVFLGPAAAGDSTCGSTLQLLLLRGKEVQECWL